MQHLLFFLTAIIAYDITMNVGEVKSAGSDGNVYIKLFGTKGESRQILLRRIGDRDKQFVAGGLYQFTIAETDIGQVKWAMTISSHSIKHQVINWLID